MMAHVVDPKRRRPIPTSVLRPAGGGHHPRRQRPLHESCHTAAKSDIKQWGASFTTIESDVPRPVALEERARPRELPPQGSGPASTSAFHARQARSLGRRRGACPTSRRSSSSAFSASTWQTQYATFKTKAGMPANNHPGGFSEAEWTTVKSWALKGMPTSR